MGCSNNLNSLRVIMLRRYRYISLAICWHCGWLSIRLTNYASDSYSMWWIFWMGAVRGNTVWVAETAAWLIAIFWSDFSQPVTESKMATEFTLSAASCLIFSRVATPRLCYWSPELNPISFSRHLLSYSRSLGVSLTNCAIRMNTLMAEAADLQLSRH